MKKLLISVLSFTILTLSLTGCSFNNTDGETTKPSSQKQEVWIDNSAFREVGKTEDISRVISEGGIVTSEDPSVINVNGNILEMKSKGFVTLKCEYDDRIEEFYYIVMSEDEFNDYEATFDSNRVIMPIGATNKWSVEMSDFTLKVSDPSVVEVTIENAGFTAKATGFGGSYIMMTSATGIILNYYVFSYPAHD